MSGTNIRDELLVDLEAALAVQGYVGLYEFAWTLRGYDRGLTAAQIKAISAELYPTFVDRFDLRLMWSRWPTDLEKAWPAAPDVELDFDLDPDAPVTEPFLILLLPSGT